MAADHQVSLRYARALFGLVDEAGTLEKADYGFAQIIELIRKHPEIKHLVSNSTISRAEKEDFIHKIFPADTEKILVNFIKVLVKKGRFSQVESIQKEFHKLFETKKGIKEVEVITAIELSDEVQQKLRSALNKKLNAEIRLQLSVDKDLIGGMQIRYDGTEIDTSYKNRLAELRQILLR